MKKYIIIGTVVALAIICAATIPVKSKSILCSPETRYSILFGQKDAYENLQDDYEPNRRELSCLFEDVKLYVL